MNKAKKSFRRRRTPYNFENLKNCENALEKVKENAKAEWTKVVCDKITYASSSKEMWESFNTLTSYQDYNRGGVIPLLDDDGSPVFNREDKCLILENVFFGGRHLNNCSFDESFKKDVEKELNTDTENTIQNKDAEELLNYDITLRPKKKIGVFTVCRPTLFYNCRPYHFFSENKKNETVFRSCFSGPGF